MSLKEFSSGDKEVEKYGELACECASKINNAVIADSSKKIYLGKVRMVISDLEEEIPDPGDVIEVISSKESSASTKNGYVMAMKTYYKVCDEFELAEELSQLAEMEDFSEENAGGEMHVEEWITEDEVMRILDNLCPEGTNKTKRAEFGGQVFLGNQDHRALVATLYYTGLRVSECLMIELEHLDFEDNRMIVYRKKKGGNKPKKDTIRIADEFIDILKDYIDAKDIEGGRLFDMSKKTVENRINEIEEAYKGVWRSFDNCENLTPHKFRHGRVTEIAKTSGLEAAGEFVDHESLETTMGYKHITTDDQEGILPEDNRSEDKSEIEELLEESDAESVDDLKKELLNNLDS